MKTRIEDPDKCTQLYLWTKESKHTLGKKTDSSTNGARKIEYPLVED
jgi:hypothetical protein